MARLTRSTYADAVSGRLSSEVRKIWKALRGRAGTMHPVRTLWVSIPLTTREMTMRLGNFSVSLAVKDVAASRAFYEKLGFRVIGGDAASNWLILQNETATIGLFQGMFEKNMLTFNPGWDRTCATLPDFDDVRDMQRTLVNRGVALASKADESTKGPASLMVIDPDGNPILVDQHVPSPRK
jgi:catechol 2,3-dioxygenase-like lactoylglutathione lyase family enzyme